MIGKDGYSIDPLLALTHFTQHDSNITGNPTSTNNTAISSPSSTWPASELCTICYESVRVLARVSRKARQSRAWSLSHNGFK